MRKAFVVAMSAVAFGMVTFDHLANARRTVRAQESQQERLQNLRTSEPVTEEREPKQEQTAQSLDQWPMECEGAARSLDFAVIDAKKLEGSYLIIVARLGSRENSAHLNQARLAVAEEYVLRRGSDLKYVLAQGERVKGLGRLELYVGGRLREILPLKKNTRGYCTAK